MGDWLSVIRAQAETPLSKNASPVAINHETFWSQSFGKLEEVTWNQFVGALEETLKTTFEPHHRDALYCIANVMSDGSLPAGRILTRGNFRLMMTMFGPLAECHVRCHELVSAGYFHGEQTSQESEDLLAKNGKKPGLFLIRLRKGARHQMAIASVDDTATVRHTLVTIAKNRYSLHATGGSFSSVPQMIEACASKFSVPINSDIMKSYGPSAKPRAASRAVAPQPGEQAAFEAERVRLLKELEEAKAKLVEQARIREEEERAAAEQGQLGGFSESRKLSVKDLIAETSRLKQELQEAKKKLSEQEQEMKKLVESGSGGGGGSAMAPPPAAAAAQQGTGSGPRPSKSKPADYLKALIANMKPGAIFNIRVPVLSAQRKMRFDTNLTGAEVMDRILRKVPVQNQVFLGLYLTNAGVWLEPDRPLSSYLVADEDLIDVLYKPRDANPCVLPVRSTISGETESVDIDDHTTVLGIIQAMKKRDPTQVGSFGLRVSRPDGSTFFCEPFRGITEYGLGGMTTSIVDFMVVDGPFLAPSVALASQLTQPDQPRAPDTPRKPEAASTSAAQKPASAELLQKLSQRLVVAEKKLEEAKLEELISQADPTLSQVPPKSQMQNIAQADTAVSQPQQQLQHAPPVELDEYGTVISQAPKFGLHGPSVSRPAPKKCIAGPPGRPSNAPPVHAAASAPGTNPASPVAGAGATSGGAASSPPTAPAGGNPPSATAPTAASGTGTKLSGSGGALSPPVSPPLPSSSGALGPKGSVPVSLNPRYPPKVGADTKTDPSKAKPGTAAQPQPVVKAAIPKAPADLDAVPLHQRPVSTPTGGATVLSTLRQQSGVTAPGNMPPMDPGLVRITKWLSDILTLQAWWQALPPESKSNPTAINSAIRRVRPLFAVDDPDEAKKTVKLQEVLTKQQLLSLVDCLSRVSSYQQH